MQNLIDDGQRIKYGVSGYPGTSPLIRVISLAAQILSGLADYQRQFGHSNRPLLSWIALFALLHLTPDSVAQQQGTWPHWGGDAGGMRYAELDQITPQNVDQLEELWSWRHGDVSDGSPPFKSTTAFQLTPLLVGDTLYGCTPFNRVFALDPLTGEQRWIFDPEIDRHASWANQMVCRGVASFIDAGEEADALCRHRILTNTADARLFALDAATGKPCDDFGEGGSVDLNPGVGE